MDVAVGLVKAYLELCGYFVLAELPVRAPDRDGYRDVTDLDIVAVRFPHPPRHPLRALDVFLGQDPALGLSGTGVDVLVGEVKEGQARLNPALRRAATVAFALRRVGCCPEGRVDEEARAIAERGEGALAMPGGTPCRVRVVAFGGCGGGDMGRLHTIPLHRCVEFIVARLRDGREVLAGVQFTDPVLGLFALEDKLARQVFAGAR